jgi:hypothetical protein
MEEAERDTGNKAASGRIRSVRENRLRGIREETGVGYFIVDDIAKLSGRSGLG